MPSLAQKLGIKPGHRVCLLNAPPAGEALVRQECPPGVTVSPALEGKHHLILLWPTQLEGLATQLSELQHHIFPDGAIWLVIPKKRFAQARGVHFTWEQMQQAALQTDLVDNKDASFSLEEYGTRFVIRKNRRLASS